MEIGDKMGDGTIYAGISPTTHEPFYTLPANSRLKVRWEEAMQFARTHREPGIKSGTFRLPTPEELDIIYANRFEIGGFRRQGLSTRFYWSSQRRDSDEDMISVKNFLDGSRRWVYKNYTGLNARYVRD